MPPRGEDFTGGKIYFYTGAGTATQPVQAPGSVPDGQPTGEGDLSAASDSEADQLSVTGSLDDEIHRDRSPDRDVTRDEADQEPTEEANYRETMRGVRSFMNWHKIPEFETVSSAADDNPFAGARVQSTGKVSVKLPVDDWLCRKMSTLNLTITEGHTETYLLPHPPGPSVKICLGESSTGTDSNMQPGCWFIKVFD